MKRLLHSIINILCYGGLSKASMKQVNPLIRDANFRNYKIIAPLATILFAGLFVSNIGRQAFSAFMFSQIVMMVISLAISVMLNVVWTSKSKLLMPSIYFLNLALMTFAIILGVFQNPNHYAVTFMVLLVCLPLITLDRPIRLGILSVMFTAVFSILCYFHKDPSIVKTEIANAIFFNLMSLFFNVKINCFRIKGYYLRFEKIENSWTDPFTNTKNYFAYSKFKEETDELIHRGRAGEFAIVVCNVNNLKNINDSEGYEKGDEYLLKNCRAICQIYAGSSIYRVGGDSFVVALTGKNYDDREQLFSQCLSEVAKDSYGVTMSGKVNFAIGMAAYDRNAHKCYHDVFRQAAVAMDECKSLMKAENIKNEYLKIQEPLSFKKTILAIDCAGDELEMLLSDKYQVEKVNDNQSGIELLKEKYGEIALVILEAKGEGFSCHDFLSSKKDNIIINNIPVLVLADKEANEEQCLVLGAKDFIRKPYSANILISRVDNLIGFRESSAILSTIEYDSLTGLYTKQAFFHYANQVLSDQPDIKYSLLISDIDDFKSVNEMFGTEIGDSVLKETADFVKGASKVGVISGRYGNDQFVSLIPFSPELSDEVLENINNQLLEKSLYKNLKINAKFGIYDNVDHDVDISVSCDRAMMALKTIKHKYGKLFARYDSSIQEAADRKFQIEQSMQDAYDHDMFKVYYQPKHDARTGKLVGAEALIRWIHPIYGFMPPNEFIPLFEKNGFITYADFYVWNRSCMNLRKWLDRGIKVVPVSVNSSRKDFEYENYLEQIKKPLLSRELDPALLHIEVTESLFADNIDEMRQRLDECNQAGFKIELDDFGSGYSSLNTLGKLPIDVLKLDMDFLKDSKDTKKGRVLAATITLAHTLGLKVVAEGVETDEQLAMLRSIQCDSIQGYYYSKPLPEDEFEQYLIDYMNKGEDAFADNNAESEGSGCYVIDEEYNVISYNDTLKNTFPMIEMGKKCHECLQNSPSPCKMCPVANKVKGRQIYLDPIRKVYEGVDVVDINMAEGRKGHAIVIETML